MTWQTKNKNQKKFHLQDRRWPVLRKKTKMSENDKTLTEKDEKCYERGCSQRTLKAVSHYILYLNFHLQAY